MKNQFFADNRDLFKFDLVQILKNNIYQQNQIYYIPMLTENDGTNNGGQTDRSKAKAGYENKKLLKYLDKCIRTGKRNIKEIKEYYSIEKIDINIYREEDDYFNHTKRDDYFKQAIKDLSNNSLILVDPDNGMEVDRSNEKHILFSELLALYGSMADNSILMIYQHFPRIKHRKYIRRRLKDIKTHIVSKVITQFISDNEIIFFLLTKTPAMSKKIGKIINNYKNKYKDLY